MDRFWLFMRRTSQSFKKGNSIHPQLEGLDSEADLKAAIQDLCRVAGDCDPVHTLDERKRAVKNIGHLVWTRGLEIAVFASERCLPLFVTILASQEDLSLKQEILSTLGELFQSAAGDRRVTQHLQNCHLPTVLLQLLSSQNQSIVQWCLHAMVFLSCGIGNPKKIFSQKEIEELKDRALQLSVVDWSAWRHNEAEELIEWLQQPHK